MKNGLIIYSLLITLILSIIVLVLTINHKNTEGFYSTPSLLSDFQGGPGEGRLYYANKNPVSFIGDSQPKASPFYGYDNPVQHPEAPLENVFNDKIVNGLDTSSDFGPVDADINDPFTNKDNNVKFI